MPLPRPTVVDDCMHRNPLTISCDANIVEAIEIMVENKLTGLTVTDETGKAIAVLSELDCLAAILHDVYNDGDPEHSLVRDAASVDLHFCKPDDSIVEVAQAMLDSRQRRRPVIADGKLVGQVSSSNILWALMENTRRKINTAGK
jgi:CBS domain-containing protein